MDADMIRSLSASGANVIIFSGANSGVMRSDLKSIDSMPSDEVLDERRQELDLSILAVRNSILTDGVIPQNVSFSTDPSNPFPKVIRDWWVSGETTRDIINFLCLCGLADGSETGWSNGFLGSRWADTIINRLRLRIAFYSREKDPKYFATLERQNCGVSGKHQFLFIFNTLYFQEDESHRTVIFATPEEDKEHSKMMLDACPNKDSVFHLHRWNMVMKCVGNIDQTVVIHDDEGVFAKTKEDFANPSYEICCLCKKEIVGYGNNPEPVRTEGHCCDRCNTKYVVPERMRRLHEEDVARIESVRKVEIAWRAEEKKKHEAWLKSQEAESKKLAKEVEAKKKADALAKKTADEEDRLKNMDEGKLKAFIKTIPPRPAKTIRSGAGCVIDQSAKQKQWDEKWGQYKKYLK